MSFVGLYYSHLPSARLTFGFLFSEYDDCLISHLWNSFHIVSYEKNSYAILWGCRNISDEKHEQGAWVLGFKKNFSEAAKLLDRFLNVDLSFAKASSKDFLLYNQTYAGNSYSCTSMSCANNFPCKAIEDPELD